MSAFRLAAAQHLIDWCEPSGEFTPLLWVNTPDGWIYFVGV